MYGNPFVAPIRIWQAGVQFWQEIAIAQLQMQRCTLTLMGLWPSDQLKALGRPKAATSSASPARQVLRAVAPDSAKPAEKQAALATAEPQAVAADPVDTALKPVAPRKAGAAKAAPAAGRAKAPVKAVRGKAAAGQASAKQKAAPQKASGARDKRAEPAPLSDTRH